MILSIDESIQRLKAEILAQDWRLSPRRLDSIEAAFACLKTRFKTRKGMLAILAMAESVVVYMKKRQETPPETIDFLKETMAHIVSLYEERDYNPEHEEELFRRIFKRYSSLKQKVQDSRERPAEAEDRQEAAEPPAAAMPAPAGAETAPPSQPGEAARASYATEQLLSRLRLILSRKDGSTTALQRFLEETVALAGGGEPITTGRLRAILDQMAMRPQDATAAPSEPPATGGGQKKHEPVACEETPVRRLVIGTTQLLVPEEQIALIRPLKAGKLSPYLRSGRIGLVDFSRLMQGLAVQFSGPLAAMKDRQLKKLALPVITPQGLGLPELPDEQATGVLVLSHDNWHGAVFCSSIADQASGMIKFRKGKNGDIAGTAWLVEGDALPLLNVAEFLRREGFLTMVAE